MKKLVNNNGRLVSCICKHLEDATMVPLSIHTLEGDSTTIEAIISKEKVVLASGNKGNCFTCKSKEKVFYLINEKSLWYVIER